MTRQEMIAKATADVAAAADYSKVGTPDFFGDAITSDHVTDSVRSAIDRLNSVLAKTDEEWAKLWADSEAEEQRVEEDAWRFAAGKS